MLWAILAALPTILKFVFSEMFFCDIVIFHSCLSVTFWGWFGETVSGSNKEKISKRCSFKLFLLFLQRFWRKGGRGRLLRAPSILLGQDVWTKKCDWCSISGRLCCQYCLWASPSSIHLPQCFSHLSNISIFRCFHILFLTFFLGKPQTTSSGPLDLYFI